MIDIEVTDIANPLALFNHTLPNKEGVYGLVRTLNASLDERALADKVLDQVFDTYWPQFEKSFQQALECNPVEENVPPRSEGSMLSEVIGTVRALDRKIRNLESISNQDRERKSLASVVINRKKEKSELEEQIAAIERLRQEQRVKLRYFKNDEPVKVYFSDDQKKSQLGEDEF